MQRSGAALAILRPSLAMSVNRPSTLRRLALAFVLGVGALGCRSTGDSLGESTVWERALVAPDENGSLAALAARQPADIFVAPVVDLTAAFEAPANELRLALYEGLVGRLYSPLRLTWADEALAAFGDTAPSIAEASALLGADAILEVRLVAWDESALERDGFVRATVAALLIDPAAPEAPLWGWELAREVDVGGSSTRRSTRDVLAGQVAKTLAAELLALLPARDARLAQ
jgi:hypothetical protein